MSDVGTKAKRGDLFVLPVTHSYTLARGGGESWKSFTLGEVLGISREGRVKAWRELGSPSDYTNKSSPHDLYLIDKEKVDVPAIRAAFVARTTDWYDTRREFETLEQAREFVRRFLR